MAAHSVAKIGGAAQLKAVFRRRPVVTKLIEADLVDSDYWWWRGRHYAEAKDFDRAEADFRQSNANKPSGWGSGKMSGYLGDARPCESAFLVSRYTEQSERKIGDWALPAKTKHWVAGGCDALAGKGSTTIRWKSTAPVVKTKVKVEKVSADAIVDVKAGYTVVSKRSPPPTASLRAPKSKPSRWDNSSPAMLVPQRSLLAARVLPQSKCSSSTRFLATSM